MTFFYPLLFGGLLFRDKTTSAGENRETAVGSREHVQAWCRLLLPQRDPLELADPGIAFHTLEEPEEAVGRRERELS